MKRFCFVCSVQFESSIDGSKEFHDNHPISNGLICRTYGNWGSTVYDSGCEDEYLQFYICDRCAIKNIDKIDEITKTDVGEKISTSKEWAN